MQFIKGVSSHGGIPYRACLVNCSHAICYNWPGILAWERLEGCLGQPLGEGACYCGCCEGWKASSEVERAYKSGTGRKHKECNVDSKGEDFSSDLEPGIGTVSGFN